MMFDTKNNEFALKIGRLTKSVAYLDFCEELYGYREYMFNMTDNEQLGYLLNRVGFTRTDTVLDLGCGNGGILNLISNKYGCHGIGIDVICVEQAGHSERTEFICGDINCISGYRIKPTVALSVDGLYFGCDLDRMIRSLCDMKTERFCFFWSQYLFDEKGNSDILQRDNTVLATTLHKAGIGFDSACFSENEYKMYLRSLSILEKHRSAFQAENIFDLYEQKLYETKLGIKLYENGLASRYLYTGEFQSKKI